MMKCKNGLKSSYMDKNTFLLEWDANGRATHLILRVFKIKQEEQNDVSTRSCFGND
jgi:hypothetical protein